MGRLFNQGPISAQVIPKTQKIALDTSLLSTQHYKCYTGTIHSMTLFSMRYKGTVSDYFRRKKR